MHTSVVLSRSSLGRKELFEVAFLLIIITAANKFFNFGWWWAVAGIFNVADVGNALIWCAIGWLIVRRGTQRGFWNPIAKLIAFYLTFVLVHVALGSLYYRQPLLSGIVGARHQFYFGSFYLFWILLDDMRKIRVIMIGLIMLGIFAVVLGIIEYLGFSILDHRQAEQVIMRSGIERGYIPGMSIVSAAAIAASSIWIETNKVRGKAGTATLILMAAHIFRQSRMRLFGVTLIIMMHLLLRKRYKLILVGLFVGGSGLLITNLLLPENIILSLLERSETEFVEERGSIGGRLQQMKTDLEEFQRHPIMGSGTSTLRPQSDGILTEADKEQWLLSYKADLGYTHWMKAYGVVGLIWLSLFFGILLKRAAKAVALCDSTNKDVTSFAMGYLAFVVFSFVTLNHLMFTHGIVLVCLVSAIIMRLSEHKVSEHIPPAAASSEARNEKMVQQPRILRKIK